ncbi:ubiquinone/menaquinone biosynthesis protein [Solidesulfovibrio carbinolicus]|uniref:Ubiquinone/menaquinone biosynthesis protein n=2 Tax=Solidesulfovibrio carbinolicus TaxID=296842 RepID=A0A4V0YQI7_9BACT|nr:methyltransferase domain-containing protein [Solidesulfovibrio carbinolicus]QAZ66442.1 ubiquinone/menaquinone biosynthesis protein [Solidesulfovibrio carbinolicus]
MQSVFPAVSPEDRVRIRQAVLAKYEQVAVTAQGQFRYPVGSQGLAGLGYDAALTAQLPVEVLAGFVGVGNPLAAGRPEPGERILDIGCGAGVDALLAALPAGPEGFVAGLEYSPALARRAEANRSRAGLGNVAFCLGSAEALPYGDAAFDLALSNGVFNLVVDKQTALAEAFRVLRPGGRLAVSDQIRLGPPPQDHAAMVASWFT